MFLVVGLGLALPYVVISFAPGLARYLPKPGAWMERFKVAMGFPMAATAFWLLSLLGRHYGNAGVLWIGVYLVFVALAFWVWGEFVQRNARRKPLAIAISVAFLVTGYGLALERQLDWRSPELAAEDTGAILHSGGIGWERWNPEAVAKAREAGRPVLVDFTADWCVTCQLNKKTSLEIESVAAKLNELNVVALLGDYTLKDPRITAELQRWGRPGCRWCWSIPRTAIRPRESCPSCSRRELSSRHSTGRWRIGSSQLNDRLGVRSVYSQITPVHRMISSPQAHWLLRLNGSDPWPGTAMACSFRTRASIGVGAADSRQHADRPP
jgi:hypothetical protein